MADRLDGDLTRDAGGEFATLAALATVEAERETGDGPSRLGVESELAGTGMRTKPTAPAR